MVRNQSVSAFSTNNIDEKVTAANAVFCNNNSHISQSSTASIKEAVGLIKAVREELKFTNTGNKKTLRYSFASINSEIGESGLGLFYEHGPDALFILQVTRPAYTNFTHRYRSVAV